MPADIVFRNGQIVTVDATDRIAQAVATKENRILAVGDNASIERYIGRETTIIDLQGRSMLPGFIDAHLHITLMAANTLGVNCKAPHIQSLHHILEDLQTKAQQAPKGDWIRAWGFNETKVVEKRYPTRWELDAISIDHPIIVVRTCSHISAVNSKALELAGIDANTPDPPGGKIERDANGVPTGVLIENAHMHLNQLAKCTEAEIRKGMLLASRQLLANGITSIHDAGAYGPESLRILQQAILSDDIQVRIYAMIGALSDSRDFVKKMTDAGIVTGLGNERFKIGPAKVFIDGSSSGPTISTRQPYTSDSNNYGILYFGQEQLQEALVPAHERGFQITAHAQGDRAIEMMLNCIETALQKQPRANHRHRIEHAGVTTPDLMQRMKELGVIPVPNPPFLYEFGEGYLKHYGERVNHMFPARAFINAGIIAAAGSDCPITDCNPLLGIHTAVHRRTQAGLSVGDCQRIGLLEAVRLYTWNGAYASFDEQIKGSIEAGKLADLVVLSEPILDTPPERLKDVTVDMTVLDGKIVYKKGEGESSV
ncbi:MAG: amidohydrolase [Clostridia bacterium]